MDELDPALPVEYGDSRFFFGFAAALYGTLAVGAAMLPGGFIGTLILAPAAVWATHRLFSRDARLVITDEGIEDRTPMWGLGTISWSEIVDVRGRSWGHIEIELRDEQALWDRLGFVSRLACIKRQLYGIGLAAVSTWDLAPGKEELLAAVEARMDAYVLRSARAPEDRQLEDPA